MKGALTIGELARMSGLTPGTVRRYEQLDLLPPRRRRRARFADRPYHVEHLRRLRFIKRAVSLGFALEDIPALGGLEGTLRTCRDARDIAVARLESQRRAGTPVVARLEELLDLCPGRGRADECPILRYLDADGGP